MATIKLYDQDSHQTTCEAVVTGCIPWKEDSYAVTLDQTVLFPEGGGQPADMGSLAVGKKMIPVADVREKDGEVCHIIQVPLEQGQPVKVQLDWDRRLDHIQQHTGEHILSHAVWHLCGANNIGFHLGKELVTIDLDRVLTPEELDRAEDYANRQVFENRPIRVFTATAGELKTRVMRKTTDRVQGDLRVVEVEGGDCCTCCGTHAHTSGEVGLIKIIRQDSHKGGARLLFLCGGRALADYRQKNKTVLEAGAVFSAKEEGILPAIHRLREESAAAGARLREVSARLMDYRAKELLSSAMEKDGQRGLVATEENCPPKEARVLLGKLLEAPGLVAAVVTSWEGQLGYLIGKSEGSAADCRFLCDLLGGLLCGRGGGKESFAQGSAKPSPDWQNTAAMLLPHMLRQTK